MKFLLLSIVALYFANLTLSAQSQPADLSKYTDLVSEERLRRVVSFLSDDSAGGRRTGSSEMTMVTAFLLDRFKSMPIIPLSDSTMVRSFLVNYTAIGRNIIGVLPSRYYTDKYVVVSAHYDHIGTLDGNIYNGADDNASGVAALLTIADMFSRMRYDNIGPAYNIIFALFDAKESNMAGSENFLNNLPIPEKNILYEVNIDQIGCTLSPPGHNENYILMLADQDIRYDIRRRLDYINTVYRYNMDIDHTFYNSPPFLEVFFKISDQYSFSKRGIPSILFTSGINMHTYKQEDDYDLLNYPVLANRTKLIFHLINNLLERPF